MLNILFHYALVQLDNATLARNFIDAIANDWATKEIKTAQEAMEAVRNRDLQREVKRKQQLHNAGKNNYRRQGGYQEQLQIGQKILMRRRNKLLLLVKTNQHKFQVI